LAIINNSCRNNVSVHFSGRGKEAKDKKKRQPESDEDSDAPAKKTVKNADLCRPDDDLLEEDLERTIFDFTECLSKTVGSSAELVSKLEANANLLYIGCLLFASSVQLLGETC
jgi:hypothetical protein